MKGLTASIMMVLGLQLLFATSLGFGARCPAPLIVDSSHSLKAFNLSLFTGPPPGAVYYEPALHDYTQPNVCGCQRSEKVLLKDWMTTSPWRVLGAITVYPPRCGSLRWLLIVAHFSASRSTSHPSASI
jgi:hypothetical protein